MQNFSLSKAIRERFEAVENEFGYSEHIMTLDCESIDLWDFSHRQAFELGDINKLAKHIKGSGQHQPIIVVRASAVFRPKNNHSAQYVVVSGQRRWLACKQNKMDVFALVRPLNFEQAIEVMASDEKEAHLSEYSKGMLFHRLLDTEQLSKKQLCELFNLTKELLHSYLAFARVPTEIWSAVGNLSQISCKVASVIDELSRKGTLYTHALISIASKIEHGYGEKRIRAAVEKLVHFDSSNDSKKIIHKIKCKGKVVMSLNQGKITLDKSLISDAHFNELIANIERDVTDFATHYLE